MIGSLGDDNSQSKSPSVATPIPLGISTKNLLEFIYCVFSYYNFFTTIILYYFTNSMTACLLDHDDERPIEEIEHQARTLPRNIKVRSNLGNIKLINVC